MTVRELALAGAKVVLCSRDVAKGEAAKASLPQECQQRVEVMELDLGSISSITSFAKTLLGKFPRLDVVILNAGVAKSFLGSGTYRRTSDGFEEMIGVNFLGHFLLTKLLLPALRAAVRGRVVVQSSVAAANSYPSGIDVKSWTERTPRYNEYMQYGQSKMAACSPFSRLCIRSLFSNFSRCAETTVTAARSILPARMTIWSQVAFTIQWATGYLAGKLASAIGINV